MTGQAGLATNMKTLLYPNPATNTVNVHVDGQPVSEEGLMILDVQGRACHPAAVRRTGMSDLQLDISNLNNGLYWIKVRTGNTLSVFQLIKL